MQAGRSSRTATGATDSGRRPAAGERSARRSGRRPRGRTHQGTRVRDKLFSLSIARAFAEFGTHSVIQLPTRLVNEHRIAVGSGVFIGANSWLQVLEPDGDVALSIGNGVSVSGNLVLSASTSLRIGDNVSFARNVYVADHSHAYTDPSVPILAQGIDDIAPVEIDEGAWLGQNVVVLGGVRIGKNAVISAGSVVTSNVGDHCLAMGAPARVVRKFGPVEAESAAHFCRVSIFRCNLTIGVRSFSRCSARTRRYLDVLFAFGISAWPNLILGAAATYI